LSHSSSPFYSDYFGDGVSQVISLGWPQTEILLISASQGAGIYRCRPLAWLTHLFLRKEEKKKGREGGRKEGRKKGRKEGKKER
jgi:hypothetical protein